MDIGSILSALKLRTGIWVALCAASALIIFGPRWGLEFLSDIDPSYVGVAKVSFVIFACLCVVSAFEFAARVVARISAHWKAISEKRRLESTCDDALNDISAKEWAILAYLVTRNERHFHADMTGGEAAGLISRGIIHGAVRKGQVINALSMPFTVNEHIWRALIRRRSEFVHPNPTGPAPFARALF